MPPFKHSGWQNADNRQYDDNDNDDDDDDDDDVVAYDDDEKCHLRIMQHRGAIFGMCWMDGIGYLQEGVGLDSIL